jgi:hypothetical protein
MLYILRVCVCTCSTVNVLLYILHRARSSSECQSRIMISFHWGIVLSRDAKNGEANKKTVNGNGPLSCWSWPFSEISYNSPFGSHHPSTILCSFGYDMMFASITSRIHAHFNIVFTLFTKLSSL